MKLSRGLGKEDAVAVRLLGQVNSVCRFWCFERKRQSDLSRKDSSKAVLCVSPIIESVQVVVGVGGGQ